MSPLSLTKAFICISPSPSLGPPERPLRMGKWPLEPLEPPTASSSEGPDGEGGGLSGREQGREGERKEGEPGVGVEEAGSAGADWLPGPALPKRFIRVGAAGTLLARPRAPGAAPGSERPYVEARLAARRLCAAFALGRRQNSPGGRRAPERGGPSAMRRASRDYTKYLRASEEMGSGGSGAPHEGALHAPPPPPPAQPAPHHSAAASRSTFVALLGLGLGQVACSVALFLYFRAQVSARLPGARGRGAPAFILQHFAGDGV